MSALNQQDLLVLSLALNLLQKYTNAEHTAARKSGNKAKTAAMVNMQEQIAGVRVKILRMQGAPIRDSTS